MYVVDRLLSQEALSKKVPIATPALASGLAEPRVTLVARDNLNVLFKEHFNVCEARSCQRAIGGARAR